MDQDNPDLKLLVIVHQTFSQISLPLDAALQWFVVLLMCLRLPLSVLVVQVQQFSNELDLVFVKFYISAQDVVIVLCVLDL